jgi:hypothetical protein
MKEFLKEADKDLIYSFDVPRVSIGDTSEIRGITVVHRKTPTGR